MPSTGRMNTAGPHSLSVLKTWEGCQGLSKRTRLPGAPGPGHLKRCSAGQEANSGVVTPKLSRSQRGLQPALRLAAPGWDLDPEHQGGPRHAAPGVT